MICPACHTEAPLQEQLSTRDLARHWAETQAHGEAVGAEIAGFVRHDIGSDTVDVYHCPRCQLEFLLPARTWSAAHYPHEEHSLGWDHFEALRLLGDGPAREVLDIGCATGQFLEKLRHQGHRATGIDFSEEDIAVARAAGHEAYVADLSRDNELVAGGRHFGVITMFQVVEHLESPDLVFAGMARVAERGARLLIGCPSARRYTRAFPHTQLVGTSDFWDSPPQHVLRWTPEALTAFAARHGWLMERTAFEPLRPVHAAAHLAALSRYATKAWPRRVATLAYLLRLRHGNRTGIRLFWSGRLVG